VSVIEGSLVPDKNYLVRLRLSSSAIQHVVAAGAETHGEHLVFLDSRGKLAGQFLMEIVQSWNVISNFSNLN
jgi:hypothetical protein